MRSSNGWYVASVQAPVDETINGKYRYQGWTPCIKWCEEQFGNRGIYSWIYQSEGVFEFCEEQDYAWFVLRWS